MRTERKKENRDVGWTPKTREDEEDSYKASAFLSLSPSGVWLLGVFGSLLFPLFFGFLYGYASVGRWHRRDLGIPNSSKPSENSRKVHWERSGAYH